MNAKLVSTLATSLFAAAAAAAPALAACSDRPGTPTGVTATLTSQVPPIIQVSWTNTATERVWWDVEMTDGNGSIAQALPAGVGRGDEGKGLRISNSFTVPNAVTRCFRVRARTEPKTGGCVSAIFSNRACLTTPGGSGQMHHGPETCKSGFVWREATPNDFVCVTPGTRTATRRDNAAAAGRRQPGGGTFGADTCRQGFVWREAVTGDHVCVLPSTRDRARQDNSLAAQRRVRG